MKIVGSLILVIFSLLSCNKQQSSSYNSFSLDDFHKTDISSSRELLTEDAQIIGNPLNIKVINDTIIAISRMDGNIHVILYNTKSNSSQISVFRGNGPIEMINVCGMSVDNAKTLWLVGQIDKKIMTTEWNENGADTAVTIPKIHSPLDMLRGVSDGNGGVIAMPAVPNSLRLVNISNNGEVKDSISNFPETELPPTVSPNNFIFQADLCYSPSVDKAVVANRSWNEIEIYDINNHKINSIKAPIKENIKIETQAHGEAYSCEPKPLWHLFSGVSCGNKYFLVGFVGVEIQSDSDYDKGCKELWEFDWTGKPNRAFVPATDVVLFDVDYDNGYIYTIENTPDPSLYRYKIE